LARTSPGLTFADCAGADVGDEDDGLACRRSTEDCARDLGAVGFTAVSRGASTLTGGSAAVEALWPTAGVRGTNSDIWTAATLTPHKARYLDIT
jgi:hypothetical protein